MPYNHTQILCVNKLRVPFHVANQYTRSLSVNCLSKAFSNSSLCFSLKTYPLKPKKITPPKASQSLEWIVSLSAGTPVPWMVCLRRWWKTGSYAGCEWKVWCCLNAKTMSKQSGFCQWHSLLVQQPKSSLGQWWVTKRCYCLMAFGLPVRSELRVLSTVWHIRNGTENPSGIGISQY